MKKTESGLSLIEMMVSVTVAMILSIVTLMLFSGQMRIFSQVAIKENTAQEVQSASIVISQLLRQAVICQNVVCTTPASIEVTYGGGNRQTDGEVLRKAGKTVQVDFTIPVNYAVWPNDVAPFNNNFIRLAWVEDVNQPNGGEVTISNATSAAGHNAASTRTLLGSSKLVVSNFDLWPMLATDAPAPVTTCTVATACGTAAAAGGGCPCGGYELSITAHPTKQDGTYTNVGDPNNALGLQHFRTITLRSNVFPRN